MTNTVLILGGTGRFGRQATQAFQTAGWTVRQFDRKRDDLDVAAKGADVIVAAWNPPYNHWAAQVAGQHAEVRAAALANDATVIIPGNVYIFGPDAPTPWGAETPHLATNLLGKIRIDMEAAYRREGVRTIILRSGDYLDTEASGNWFDMIIAKPIAKGRISYPGNRDIAHAWGYLPDVARATVQLAEMREALNRFEDISFVGYTLSGHELAANIGTAIGRDVIAKPMQWWPLRFAQPFVPFIKHLFEMRYLWNTPHYLDGTRFDAILPDFKPTPVTDALRNAVSG